MGSTQLAPGMDANGKLLIYLEIYICTPGYPLGLHGGRRHRTRMEKYPGGMQERLFCCVLGPVDVGDQRPFHA